MKHQNFLLLATTAATFAVSNSAMAAGFAVSAQSAYGMGNAYAGNAAVASDASTVLTNPAGIFELDKPVFGVSAAITVSDVDFTDRGTRTNPLFGSELVDAPGGRNTNLSETPVTPGLYYARQINDKWAIGFGLNVPYGTSSEYDEDWVGRYHAVESSVTAIDFNPTVAYRVNDKVSLGGGISIQRVSATLTNKLDSGATCELVALQTGAPAGTCAAIGLQPNDQSLDSDVELDGTGTKVTFNLGVLFKPREGTKIGVAYRHGADHELDGDATFEVNPSLSALLSNAPAPRFLDNTGTEIAADLPATLDLSVAQMVHEKVELLGTLKWTGWSSFDELTSDFDSPAQPDSSLPFDWEDSVTVSAGFNYDFNNKLTLRAGLSFDETPIPNAQVRSPRGATNDRYWYSIGGTYTFSDKISASFAATHIEIDDTPIDNTGATTGSPTLRGEYEFDVNLFAVQLNWHFI